MRKFDDYPYVKNAISFIIAGLVLLMAYFTLQNFATVQAMTSRFMAVIAPFIYGVSIAFLLSPMVYWFEHRVLVIFKWKTRTKHVLSVILTLIAVTEIIVLFFAFVIPQVITSVANISGLLPSYITTLNGYLKPYMDAYLSGSTWINDLLSSSESLMSQALTLLQNYLPNILDFSVKVSQTIVNLMLALTLAVYLLLDEKAFSRQFKRFLYAVFGQRIGDEVVLHANLTSFMLHKFILGKALNSFIMAVLCYLAMLILNIEYPVFMSSLFGITNMIPFFGPFIGGAVGLIILLIENPTHALYFLIIIIVLQNIEGSVLGPIIIGDSMGLPGLWVMFAIIVGGGYFGILGMFLGVPVFAVIYLILKRFVDHRIQSRQLKVDE